MNRRDFLFSQTAWAQQPIKDDKLVVIFLRGGCDALSLFPPVAGDDRAIYEAERPTLRLPVEKLLSLDGRFGFHPSAIGLKQLYDRGLLALFLAAGMPSNNRSHFDAQAFMELGTPDKKSTLDGWLTRHLRTKGQTNPLYATTLGPINPTSLLGYGDATAIHQPRRFASLGGDPAVITDMTRVLSLLYSGSDTLSLKVRSALEVINTFTHQKIGDYVPRKNIEYPKNELGNRLKTLAELIKLDVGCEVATIDMGGWDTHKYQDGTFAKQVEQLSDSIAAFYNDLEELRLNITLVVMTEFGRRLRENANRGTDHGHGGMMMVLGPKVKGGRVYGAWPGLNSEKLYQRADLAVAVDFRQVIAEILRKRRREKNLGQVFPGFHFDNEIDFIS